MAAEDRIREAIQQLLDAVGDGWTLTHYVIAMGLEQLNPDGTVESIAWYHAPDDQPHWQTGALLDRALQLHEDPDYCDDY